MSFEFAVLAISSIVAVMNPLSTTAVFLTFTKGQINEKYCLMAAKSAKLGFIILSFFALTGTLLFQIFNAVKHFLRGNIGKMDLSQW